MAKPYSNPGDFFLYKFLRNILFCLPAEASHDFALRAMKIGDGLGVSSLLREHRRQGAGQESHGDRLSTCRRSCGWPG